MSTKVDTNEEESFIILGSSPGTSLDMKYSAITNGEHSVDKIQIEEALRDLSLEAGMAFKAQFQLGDNPSPSSMMIATNMISDDKSTEELQKKFGEILDENVLLKDTLKQNNESMKEQFLLIASCQDDMMKTHQVHKEKFDETRELVAKLREENKKLKLDIARLAESGDVGKSLVNGESVASAERSNKNSVPTVYEFVTSPDDDTMNKLTAQLELVEKQRRQVIVENEKLQWQKESLEHIVDATSKDRDDLKDKLKNIELRLCSKENNFVLEIGQLNAKIQQLENKLKSSNSISNSSLEEVKKRDMIVNQLQSKVSGLQSDLKQAQLKILDLENVKLEYTRQKCSNSESVKIYKDQIQDLQNRLKEAQTTVFQPVRFSISQESECGNSEFSSLMSNVKLYDTTLKHLSELLNSVTHGTSEGIIKTMDLVLKVQEYKMEKVGAEKVKAGLLQVKQGLEVQHSAALGYIGQIRGTLSIFEAIFQDYKELLKKGLSKPDAVCQDSVCDRGNEALTSALLARAAEIQELHANIAILTQDKDDAGLLKAQIEIYKSDFEAERESRQKMASDKESVLADLRSTQRRNQDLVEQLEEVRKMNPGIFAAVTAKKPKTPLRTAPKTPTSPSSKTIGVAATGNMVFKCPKCMRFSSDQYKAMEDHFDFCLDDF